MGNKQWVLSIEGLRPRVLPPIGCEVTTGQVPPCGAFYWPAAQPLRLLLAGASACLSAARPGPARAATALREPLPPPPPRAPEVTARGRRRVSAGRRPWGEHEAGWCGEGRAAGPGRGERSWRLAASGRHGSPDGCVRGWGGRRGEGSVGRAGPGPGLTAVDALHPSAARGVSGGLVPPGAAVCFPCRPHTQPVFLRSHLLSPGVAVLRAATACGAVT